MKKIITKSSQETKRLAAKVAAGFNGGEIVCLSGDLGAGKTTFAQGLLEALGAEGPYTSPTFNIMKKYEIQNTRYKIQEIYHIDAYRISSADLLELGFADFAGKPETLTIIEWPENVSSVIPLDHLTITLSWQKKLSREITLP